MFVTIGTLDANMVLGAAIKPFEGPTLDGIFNGAEGLIPRDEVVGKGEFAIADCVGLGELTEPPLAAPVVD